MGKNGRPCFATQFAVEVKVKAAKEEEEEEEVGLCRMTPPTNK